MAEMPYQVARDALDRFRAKYTQYARVPDQVLASKLAEKYPQYHRLPGAIERGLAAQRPEHMDVQAGEEGVGFELPDPVNNRAIVQQRLAEKYPEQYGVARAPLPRASTPSGLTPEQEHRRVMETPISKLVGQQTREEILRRGEALGIEGGVPKAAYAGVMSGLLDAGSMIRQAAGQVSKRVLDEPEAAAYAEARAEELSAAGQETLRATHGDDLTRTVGTVANSLTKAFITPAGARGVYRTLTFAADQANQTLIEARQAGLSDEETRRVVRDEFGTEFLVTQLFNQIGLGGVETASLRSGAREGLRAALRQVGVGAISEAVEENATELTHLVNRAASNLDPNALTPENIRETMYYTTLAAAASGGVSRAPGVVQELTETGVDRARTAIHGVKQRVAEQELAKSAELAREALSDMGPTVSSAAIEAEGKSPQAARREALTRQSLQQRLVTPAPRDPQATMDEVAEFGEGTREATIREEAQFKYGLGRRDRNVRSTMERHPTDEPVTQPRDLQEARLTGQRYEGPQATPPRRRRKSKKYPQGFDERQFFEPNEVERLKQELVEAREETARVRKEARTDPVTGLGNKLQYDETLRDVKRRTEETGKPFSIILMDLDSFKVLNDLRGHDEGDVALGGVGKAIQSVIRAPKPGRRGDIIATRQGGDEFAVILPDTDAKGARIVRDRIEEAVGRQAIIPGLTMGVAGEVATYTPGSDLDQLLQEADLGIQARKQIVKEKLGEPRTRAEAEAAIAAYQQRTQEGLADAVRNPSDIPAASRDTVAARMVDPVRQAATPIQPQEPGEFAPDAAETVLDVALPGWNRTTASLKLLNWAAEGPLTVVEGLATPVGSVIRRFAPRLYGRIKQFYAAVARKTHEARYQTNQLEKMVKGALSKEQQQRLLYLWQTQQWNEATRFLQDNTDQASEILDQHSLVDSMKGRARQNATSVGLRVGEIPNHFPRAMRPKQYAKFLDSLSQEERTDLDRVFAQRSKKLGRDLTLAEKQKLTNQWMAGRTAKGVKISSSRFGQRSVENLTFEQWKEFYDTTFRPMYTYFDDIIYATEKARLFGRRHADDDIDEAIGRIILEGGYGTNKLTRYQMNRLRSAVTSIFTSGEQSPHRYWQFIRDLGYAGTLLDPSSAAIQFGDLALTAARDGTLPALSAVPRSFRERVLTARNLGLEALGSEYGDARGMSKALRLGFRAVGFAKVDLGNLGVSMVSAVRRGRRLATNPDSKASQKWKQEWEPVFGDQWNDLVRDLKNDTPSSLVQDYAYIQASEIRPIDMLDMPEYYSRTPNGRIAWQLKGFATKQFDFLRRQGYDKIAKGVHNGDAKLAMEGVRGLVRGMMMLSLAGASLDWIRDWLLGRNPDFSESLVNGLLYTHLGSVYLIKIAGERGPGSALTEFVSPPTLDMSDRLWKDLTTGTYSSVRHLPFGKLIYSFTPEGRAKQRKYARKDVLQEAAQAYADGDIAAARSYISAFNDEMKQQGNEERISLSSVRRSATTIAEKRE
jgi:diguanylate cyclase (GGDEF)-like protein